ncbi:MULTISPECIES: 2Fe-2S iron-sulfur cluster-binding protein [Amycolatopsis]|uniref:Toluene monooxygenase electron transfer component n=1 Tax=Amycolatopsis thermoflava TaxID=84480 RepID=A0A3N2H7G7_9PSEU|nr:2Fe-2S iron-sulfur cluster binding domain-containing protein [Amycolatopsis thermoflava]ROS44065.1 toluene monooxygenase electron transfer component [Amycolatopsis thermoflava]
MTGHHVLVEGTGVRFSCAEGDTLLRAALRAGVGLSYECNSGSCGSCRYELVDGEVRDRRPGAPGLTARDRRRGRRLACQSEPLSDCVVRAPEPAEVTTYRPVTQTALLSAVRPLTHDMSEFVFTAEERAEFAPGQYAMIHLPDGRVERAYSMSNLGNSSREWKFVVKRVPDGQATSILFDKLEVGSAVVIDGPYGHAYLRPERNRDIVCVAGGSGLGAMISIILGAAALPDAVDRTAHLFIGGRTEADIHIPDAVLVARRRLRALHVRTAVSAADGCDPQPECGIAPFRGFVHEAVVGALGENIRDFTYYAAGPPAMTDALARALVVEGGLAADHLYFDRFC